MITAEKLFGQLTWCNRSGPDEPGITRPSYSEHETKAMQVIADAAREIGLDPVWDDAGNLHVVHDGGGSEVVTGSHLDTVPNGGAYDGAAGVVAGFLALQEMARVAHPRQARLIVFRGEESAWFGKCYLGSSALFGEWTPETFNLASQDNGVTLGTRLDYCPGAERDNIKPGKWLSVLDERVIGAFIEVHIEQGPVLHEASEPLGVVTAIRGNYRYPECDIYGVAGHSGTTPMKGRADAVMAFAELMAMLELGARARGDDLVMTCGIAGTHPSRHAMTIIPDAFVFSLEFRSAEPEALVGFDRFFLETTRLVAERRRGIRFDLCERIVTPPVTLNPRVAKAISSQSPMKLRHMPSGAGHDAAVFQKHEIPTGMIFIRNEHGSHNPKESMRMDDFHLAVEVLTRTMMDPNL